MMDTTNEETIERCIEHKNVMTEENMYVTPLVFAKQDSKTRFLETFDYDGDLSVADSDTSSQAIYPDDDELSYEGVQHVDHKNRVDERDEIEVNQKSIEENVIIKRVDSFHVDITFPLDCKPKEYYEIWHGEELKRIKIPPGVQGTTVRFKMIRLDKKVDDVGNSLEIEGEIPHSERNFICFDFSSICGSIDDTFESADKVLSTIEEEGVVSVTPVDSVHLDITFPLGFNSEFFDVIHENETKRIKSPKDVQGKSIRIKMVHSNTR